MRKMVTMERWETLRRLNMSTGYQPDDLAGVAELAEDIFHVARTVVSSWNARRDKISFPPPVRNLRSGPVYSISEYVVAYADWHPVRGNKSGAIDDLVFRQLDHWLDQIREEDAA